MANRNHPDSDQPYKIKKQARRNEMQPPIEARQNEIVQRFRQQPKRGLITRLVDALKSLLS